jgi:hypothetical protein
MQQGDRIVGRVIRVGRGWADVAVGNKVRRVSVRPDLLIRAGSQLILNREGSVAALMQERASTSRAR